MLCKLESQTPFGEKLVNEDLDADSEKLTLNYGLPEQFHDEETETNYNYYRTYDSSLGWYVQSDPMGLNRENNTYDYVG